MNTHAKFGVSSSYSLRDQGPQRKGHNGRQPDIAISARLLMLIKNTNTL